MHFLLCSDGTPEADNAVRFVASLAQATRARVTIFGVAERPEGRAALAEALERNRLLLSDLASVRADVQVREGEPTREILARTMLESYDLVIISARRKGGSGLHWRSARVYEIVKAVGPPVLVVVGRREKLGRILVCAGGKRYINPAVKLTTRLAVPAGAGVTLLHVLPETPAVYAGLPRLHEDSARLLENNSELSENLRAECETLVAAGVPAQIRLRSGLLLQEIAEELRTGDYDLVVTGTTLAGGPIRQYIMGDVTREIVNRAGCPVLVVRSGRENERRLLPTIRRSGLLRLWQGFFGGKGGPPGPGAGAKRPISPPPPSHQQP